MKNILIIAFIYLFQSYQSITAGEKKFQILKELTISQENMAKLQLNDWMTDGSAVLNKQKLILTPNISQKVGYIKSHKHTDHISWENDIIFKISDQNSAFYREKYIFGESNILLISLSSIELQKHNLKQIHDHLPLEGISFFVLYKHDENGHPMQVSVKAVYSRSTRKFSIDEWFHQSKQTQSCFIPVANEFKFKIQTNYQEDTLDLSNYDYKTGKYEVCTQIRNFQKYLIPSKTYFGIMAFTANSKPMEISLKHFQLVQDITYSNFEIESEENQFKQQIKKEEQQSKVKYNLTIHRIFRNLYSQDEKIDLLEEMTRKVFELAKQLDHHNHPKDQYDVVGNLRRQNDQANQLLKKELKDYDKMLKENAQNNKKQKQKIQKQYQRVVSQISTHSQLLKDLNQQMSNQVNVAELKKLIDQLNSLGQSNLQLNTGFQNTRQQLGDNLVLQLKQIKDKIHQQKSSKSSSLVLFSLSVSIFIVMLYSYMTSKMQNKKPMSYMI